MKKITLALLFICSALASAQSTDLLTHYRSMALDYNHDLKAAEQNIAASLELLGAARADLKPKLAAEASYQFTGFPTELTIKAPLLSESIHFQGSPHRYGASLSLSQPLYTGGRLLQTIRRAEHQSSYARNQADMLRNGVSLQSDVSYWNAVGSAELVGIAVESRQMVNTLTTIVRQRVEAGLVDPNDLLTAEVKLNEADYLLGQARTSFTTARMAFNSLIGVPLENPTPLDSMVLSIESLPASLASDTLVRPEQRMALDHLNIVQSERRLTDSKYLPQISVGADGSFSAPSYDFHPDPKLNYALYAKISVPLFEWGKRGRERQAATHRVAIAEQQMSKISDQVTLEVSVARSALEQATAQVALSESSLQKAFENEQRSMQRYAEGNLSILEVLQAQLYRQTAHTNYVAAKLEAQTRWSELQRALGLYLRAI